jgi:alpha-beta hydrolase superfamily lysophospholipase
MDETTFTMTAADGTEVTVDRYSPDGEPKAIVQIAHGMGEHARRYRRLAAALTGAGYVVYANDHRGHGRTAGTPDHYGDLGPGGWAGLVSDLGELSTVARKEHPGIPLVLLGHSMGSFALQQYLLDHSADLDGAVLSGTSALDLIASGIDPSQEVDLSAFNAPFQPSRTEYDWLSRDPAEVDAYVADPACGFGLGSSSVGGMLEGLAPTADQQRLAVISRHLPIYLMSGEDDPLAGGGALIDVVADRYREAGVLDVTVARYQGARHELFNETNRDEVTADLLTWLDRVVGG